MRIIFSGLRAVKQYPIIFWNDLKTFGTDEYLTENYNKHFWDSFFINLFIIVPLWFFDSISNYFFIIFLSWFSAFFYNGVREWYYETKGNTFSMNDVRFGGYGGLFLGLILVIGLMLANLLL